MSTSSFTFYHGTSEGFARQILRTGPVNYLAQIRALEFAKRVYELLLTHVGQWVELGGLFSDVGSDFWSSAPIGLRNAASGYQESLMTYGSFYVSLNPQIAVSYSVRNRAGSELLTMLQDSIAVLRARGDQRIELLLKAYPEIRTLLELAHRPVVLGVTGLPVDALQTEDGRQANGDFVEFCRRMIDEKIGRMPAAFRVRAVSPDQFVAVYPIPNSPVPKTLCDSGNLFAPFDHDYFESLRLKPRHWCEEQPVPRG